MEQQQNYQKLIDDWKSKNSEFKKVNLELHRLGEKIFNIAKEKKLIKTPWNYIYTAKFFNTTVQDNILKIKYSDGWAEEDYAYFEIPIDKIDEFLG